MTTDRSLFQILLGNHASALFILLIFVMSCIGMYIVSLQMMHFDLSFILGHFGDASLNKYFLEHGHKWLQGQVGDISDRSLCEECGQLSLRRSQRFSVERMAMDTVWVYEEEHLLTRAQLL